MDDDGNTTSHQRPLGDEDTTRLDMAWDSFSRTYTEQDISCTTIVVELSSRGFSCAPCAFRYWFLIGHPGALPEFHKALAELQASDEPEAAITDEITFIGNISEFLASEAYQTELLEDYNITHDDKLSDGYKFNICGGEAFIAEAVNGHNSIQY